MRFTKICINCGIEKTRDEFYPCSTTLDKRTDMCKECYAKKKELEALLKTDKKKSQPQKKLGAWAKGQKAICPSPISSCWLSYEKALCCCECLGRDICQSLDKCKNNVEACQKWYRRKNG